MNASGKGAVYSGLTGKAVDATSNAGLWTGTPGILFLIARKNMAAPGTTSVYGELQNYGAINASGKTAFQASLTDASRTIDEGNGIWIGDQNGVSLVARTGGSAAGTAAGTTYSLLMGPSLNSANQVGFAATLQGVTVNDANDTAIFAGTVSNVAVLAREGLQAPGRVAGVVFGDLFDERPKLNAKGTAVFHAQVTGTDVTASNSEGLWIRASGILSKVLSTGDEAPGLAGITFNAIGSTLLNDSDVVLFNCTLAGPNVTSENRESLWYATPGGTLTMLLRTGDPFEVPTLGTRILSGLSYDSGSGDEDGFGSSFNDLGELVFRATFTDGTSGIFLMAIPEPTAISMLTLSGIALFARRKRSPR